MKSCICWRFPFLCLYCRSPLIVPMLSLDCTDAIFRLYWLFPLILLKRRALNVFIASLRYRNAERSPFRQRALGN